ncbi:hypothetical protein KGF49_20725, partial [Clostridioides sp. ZZV14-5902]|nr:hypothetical protein [Clostridioides sp. ZZV14-5902]
PSSVDEDVGRGALSCTAGGHVNCSSFSEKQSDFGLVKFSWHMCCDLVTLLLGVKPRGIVPCTGPEGHLYKDAHY